MEERDILGDRFTIVTITILTICSFISAQAFSAEAFNSGKTRLHIPQHLPYQAHQAIITTPDFRYDNPVTAPMSFNAIGDAIRARFQMTINEAKQSDVPEANTDIAALFIQNFVAATGYHLIARNPSPDIAADSISLSRDDAAALLSLPHNGEQLLASHFIQPLFGTDYVIWPHQDIQPLDTLFYRAPLSAMVRYGDEQAARPFTGQFTLSFETFDGQISLSAQQEAFDLFFRIDDWQNATPLQRDALLRRGADEYPASLLLAYTNLPHSAIWGHFRNHHTQPSLPQDGYFTNFELPDDQPN